MSHSKSHTHLQFAQANATTQNCKRVCLKKKKKRNEEKPAENIVYAIIASYRQQLRIY